MVKHLHNVTEYLPVKLLSGVIASVFTTDFWQLILIFAMLELLDAFSRIIAQSYRCYRDIYPQSPCGLTTAIKFIWQARKWRYIASYGLRSGVDKLLLYLLLLMVSFMVDTAFSVGHAPFKNVMTSVTVVILGSTEALSILENLSECNEIVKRIREMVKCKLLMS